jgi:FdhE protein
MAGRFLRNVLARPAPVTPDVQAALAELEHLKKERSSLATLVAILRDALPIIGEAAPAPRLPSLTTPDAKEKLLAGIPLLRHIALTFDGNLLRRRWQRLCQLIARHRRDGVPAMLEEAARRSRLKPHVWISNVLNARSQEIFAAAVDADLAATLLRFTCFSTLVATAKELEPLRREVSWDHGYCPVCGSWPLLAEFRGLEQKRWLRCGWCASEWEAARQFCPYCGNRDHGTLGYLYVEGEENQRKAATCDLCHGYVKTVTTLKPLSPPSLLVADLATLHLDLAAMEQGFAVPQQVSPPL